MKQIYYTQEGTPYQLVTTTRTTDQTIGGGAFINPRLIVNAQPPVDVNNSLDEIYVKTDKPIVPLMMNYSLQEVTAGPVFPPLINISTPYYNQINAGQQVQSYLPALSKTLPNVEAISIMVTGASDPLMFRYGIKYNQIVLTDKDFMTGNTNNVFQFKSDLFQIYPGGISSIATIIPGRYIVVQTVIYFELQKIK